MVGAHELVGQPVRHAPRLVGLGLTRYLDGLSPAIHRHQAVCLASKPTITTFSFSFVVLTKPHTGKEKPHPSTTTEGSKPCVTK